MGRKKSGSQGQTAQDAGEQTFGRIELQAPPEWIVELDRIAESIGLSRSAYIRLACNMKMLADKKQLGMTDDAST